jgi:hypothetical protein
MNIIETLNQHHDQYIKHCFDGLKASVSIFDIDNSKGETDCVRILMLKKRRFTKQQAIAILTMRLMMYSEDWTNYRSYTKEDILRWIGFLERNYQNSIYFPNVSHDEFINDHRDEFINEHLVFRIPFQHYLNFMTSNIENHVTNRLLFPTKNEILEISKSNFERLEDEFYLETKSHFMLFNWYTTA